MCTFDGSRRVIFPSEPRFIEMNIWPIVEQMTPTTPYIRKLVTLQHGDMLIEIISSIGAGVASRLKVMNDNEKAPYITLRFTSLENKCTCHWIINCLFKRHLVNEGNISHLHCSTCLSYNLCVYVNIEGSMKEALEGVQKNFDLAIF